MNATSLNVTVTSAIISLNVKSIESLLANLPASIMLSAMGFFGSLLNVICLYVIGRSPTLHTKCYFLISNLCVADLILSGSFCGTGIKRLVRLYCSIPETASQVKCLLEMFLSFFGQEASQNFAFVIGVDRILAVFLPNWYRSASNSYSAALASLSWIYSLIIGGFAFYNTSDTTMVSNCVLSTITPEVFYNFQNSMNIVVSTITMAGYISVLLKLKLKFVTQVKPKGNEKPKSNMENRITVTLGVVVLVSFITHVVWSIAFAAIASLDTKTRNVVGPLLRNLPIFNSIANPIIYFWRSSEFRSGVTNTIRVKNEQSGSVISVASSKPFGNVTKLQSSSAV